MAEFHPSQDLAFKTHAQRIVLGSFPPFKFTRKMEEEPVEQEIRSRHFYGNKQNHFWRWYREFVDPELNPGDLSRRNESLSKYHIDVADVIYSCERKGSSPSDNDLSKRVYHHGFIDFSRNDTVKLLCTSKGVMNDMFFGKEFSGVFPHFHEDVSESGKLQHKIATGVVGAPVARVFCNNSGKRIEAVALPSPGSPFRSLKAFGFTEGDARDFLKNYLEKAFAWFLAD